MKILMLFLCLLNFPLVIAQDLEFKQLIFWNVGQGQWLTFSDENYCLHFDMGGEKAPLPEIQKLCYKKKNVLYLSHWDLDHISYIKKFSGRVFHFCLAGKPKSPRNRYKQKLSASLRDCNETPKNLVTEIYAGSGKTANSNSRVFYLTSIQVIIPGDSIKSEEAKWSGLVPRGARGLILGHHGSKTSTGRDLLGRFSRLRWAIASARQSKYGHPHQEVLGNLREKHIAVLRTEDWGNIRMQTSPP